MTFPTKELRSIKELKCLKDDDILTLDEVARLLNFNSMSWLRYIIDQSGRDFRKSKWDVDLRTLRFKHLCPPLKKRCYCIYKKDLQYFIEYNNWRKDMSEIRKNRLAYRKAMKEHYGLEGIYTNECSKNDFNCDRCINQKDCKMYNSQINVKKLTKMIDTLFKEKSLFSYTNRLENQIRELKNELKNKELQITKEKQKNVELQLRYLKLKEIYLYELE